MTYLNSKMEYIQICNEGNLESFKEVYEKYKDMYKWHCHAIALSACDNFEIFKFLLENVIYDPFDLGPAIKLAALRGNITTFKLLLEADVDPSFDMNISLSYAASKGNIEIMNLLLNDPRVDPSDNNNNALMMTIYYNKLEAFKILYADKRVCTNFKLTIYDPDFKLNDNNQSQIYRILYDDKRIKHYIHLDLSKERLIKQNNLSKIL